MTKIAPAPPPDPAGVQVTPTPPLEDPVAMLNREHALLWMSGKLVVMWRGEWEHGLPRFTRLTELKNYYKKVASHTNVVDTWLASPERAEYRNLVFKPGVVDVGKDFNLWGGWGVEPRQGDCSLFLEHLRTVICSQDEGLFTHLIQWLANIVQTPMVKPGTALALRSNEGAGKGQTFRYLQPIFGRHCQALAGSGSFLGQFNAFIAGKLLLFGDEAVWPGDKRGVERLKSYITEDRITVEQKYVPSVEVDNFARFIFATNADHAAPVSLTDRRFVPIHVSDAMIGNRAYFDALAAEIQRGGPSAFLHYLLHNVVITENLRKIPVTAEHTQQKLLSLDTVGAWWRECLMSQHNVVLAANGQVIGRFTFGAPVQTRRLHEYYVRSCSKVRQHPLPFEAFGMKLRQYVTIEKREARRGECETLGLPPRSLVYQLPALDDARRQFERVLGTPLTWTDVDVPEPIGSGGEGIGTIDNSTPVPDVVPIPSMESIGSKEEFAAEVPIGSDSPGGLMAGSTTFARVDEGEDHGKIISHEKGIGTIETIDNTVESSPAINTSKAQATDTSKPTGEQTSLNAKRRARVNTHNARRRRIAEEQQPTKDPLR
jgi:Family of unknown function (DUF5906)